MDLPRYCFCWEWEAQFRVIKPKKANKKNWVDCLEGLLAADAEECRGAVERHCQKKGWTLVELYFVAPYRLAFCFDRTQPDDHFMSREEQLSVCPKPLPWGQVWNEASAAEQRQAAQKAKLQERQKQAIARAYPLLAAELIAHEFPLTP